LTDRHEQDELAIEKPPASRDGTRSRFAMSGGTTKEITPDGFLFTMLGTPYQARGDLVGVSFEGKRSALGVGDKIDIEYSGGSCSLVLTELQRAENKATSLLRC
jgi:hypothetical protein